MIGDDDGDDPDADLDVPCGGPFVIEEWTVDVSPFPTQLINPMLATDIEAEELIVTIELVDDGGPALHWIDNVEGLDGEWVPDPRVPIAQPIAVEIEGRLVQTTEPGFVSMWVSNSEYPNAPALAWSQLDVSIVGVFAPDCTVFSGRLGGALLDGPEFTIPAAPDYDTDGDGENDAWWLESEIIARPFGLIQ